MSGGAGPGIVLGHGDHAGFHGVSFDIADRVEEVFGVQWRGAETALKEVAAGIAHAVYALGVLTVHGLEGAMKTIAVRGDDDEVHVVRHQAIRKDGYLPDSRVGVQETQVELRITVFEEDPLAVIAALRDVVWNSRKYDSVLSGHPGKLAGIPLSRAR